MQAVTSPVVCQMSGLLAHRDHWVKGLIGLLKKKKNVLVFKPTLAVNENVECSGDNMLQLK